MDVTERGVDESSKSKAELEAEFQAAFSNVDFDAGDFTHLGLLILGVG